MNDTEFDAILRKWGSETAVYKFLKEEFERANASAFQGQLTLPKLQIKPMWLSSGLMGERNSGADYEPAEQNRPAEIGIFTAFLLDEDRTRLVLVHEMIHHWEQTLATDDENEDYPASLAKEIKEGFSDPRRERSWRGVHSERFIAKAYDVAKLLSIPPRTLLYGG
jgi:hypothetical protein